MTEYNYKTEEKKFLILLGVFLLIFVIIYLSVSGVEVSKEGVVLISEDVGETDDFVIGADLSEVCYIDNGCISSLFKSASSVASSHSSSASFDSDQSYESLVEVDSDQ